MSRINATTTTRMERRAVDGGERRTKCQCVDTDLAGPSTPGLTGLLHWCIDFQRKCVFPWKPHLGRVYPEVGINLRHSGNLMAALGQSHGGARKVKRASAFARHCCLTKHARALSLPLSLCCLSPGHSKPTTFHASLSLLRAHSLSPRRWRNRSFFAGNSWWVNGVRGRASQIWFCSEGFGV